MDRNWNVQRFWIVLRRGEERQGKAAKIAKKKKTWKKEKRRNFCQLGPAPARGSLGSDQKKKASETLIPRFRRKGKGQGKGKNERKTTSLRVQLAKRNTISFLSISKNSPKPSFQSINSSQSIHSLSLQFLSAGPSTCIPPTPSHTKKKTLNFPCVFKDSPVGVCLKTHQSVCVKGLTSPEPTSAETWWRKHFVKRPCHQCDAQASNGTCKRMALEKRTQESGDNSSKQGGMPTLPKESYKKKNLVSPRPKKRTCIAQESPRTRTT